MSRRRPRVDELVKKVVAEIIERDIADPRLQFLTVTEASVSPDTKVATVFYTSLDPGLVTHDSRHSGGDRVPGREEVEAGLDSAVPRIQALLGDRIALRNTPSLRFEPDPVAAQAGRIEEILRRLPETGGDPGTPGPGESP